MSSNTLRGIGQEGGGDEKAAAGDQSATDPVSTDEGKAIETNQEQGQSGPPDSPGALSLESKGPEPETGYFKNPSLSATLLGMKAPFVESRSLRDMATVQGRDVHLPVEIRRLVEMRPVAGATETNRRTTPAGDHFKPIQPEPIRTENSLAGSSLGDPPAAAIAAGAKTTPPGDHHRADAGQDGPRVDLDTNAPWYDQDPVSDDLYDEPASNTLHRVAIGAAAAATLSVVLFVFVRLHAQDTADEEAEPSNEAQRVTQPELGQPGLPPAPGPTPDPAQAAELPATTATRAAAFGESAIDPGVPAARRRESGEPFGTPTSRVAELAARSRATAAPGPAPPARPRAPTSVSGHFPTPLGSAPETATGSFGAQRPTSSSATGATSETVTTSVRRQATESSASPLSATSPKSGIPEPRARPRPTYDPDSTMPLTIE